MSNTDNKNVEENETILMALDQIGQTIDVMNSVLGRLRTHIHKRGKSTADAKPDDTAPSEIPGDRILH